MTYKVTLGLSNKKIMVEAKSVSLHEVMLMVAQYYGEEWYGCSVADENGNFFCNAVKDYYAEGDPNKTVYQWALEDYVTSMRCRAGLAKIYETYDGTTYSTGYNPFVALD